MLSGAKMFRDGVELGWTDRRRIGTCMRPCVFIYTFFFLLCEIAFFTWRYVYMRLSRGMVWSKREKDKGLHCIHCLPILSILHYSSLYRTIRIGIFFCLSLSLYFLMAQIFLLLFQHFHMFFFLTLSFVRNLYWMHVYWVRFGVGAWCSFKKPNQRNWKAPSVKPRFMLCFGYNCLETKTHGDAWNINMRVPCPHLNTVDEILGESQKLTENYAEVATRTKQNISFHHWNQIRCIS